MMEFLNDIIKKIKKRFGRDEKVTLTASQIREQEKLNAKYNHPDDYFIEDDFMDEEELYKLSGKKKRKNTFRLGYYFVGFCLAVGMIGYGLFNIVVDSQYDMTILVEYEGEVTAEELDYITEYVKQYVPDKNGDGEVLIKTENAYIPIEETEDNQSELEGGISQIEKALVSYKISICIGRENFLDRVNEVRPLIDEDYVPLTSLENFEIEEGSALEYYYISVRETVKKGDKYSPVAQEIYQNIIS